MSHHAWHTVVLNESDTDELWNHFQKTRDVLHQELILNRILILDSRIETAWAVCECATEDSTTILALTFIVCRTTDVTEINKIILIAQRNGYDDLANFAINVLFFRQMESGFLFSDTRECIGHLDKIKDDGMRAMLIEHLLKEDLTFIQTIELCSRAREFPELYKLAQGKFAITLHRT
ncbi:MAG TPA: hypothetical protein VFV22_01520 [Candidatus Paceibacterota bacterium]|nr:hypothetical protein [Candidatus Paceibacterota bacterium]